MALVILRPYLHGMIVASVAQRLKDGMSLVAGRAKEEERARFAELIGATDNDASQRASFPAIPSVPALLPVVRMVAPTCPCKW